MNRLVHLFAVILLAGVALLVGCPADKAQSGDTQLTAAEDPHAGHDHGEGEHVEEAPAHEDEDDEHAGHDHAEGETELEHDEHEEDDHAAHDDEEHAAAAEDEHAGDDHEAEGEAAGITLSAEQLRELGIESAPAGPGSLGRELQLTGEVAINEDAVTHVAPRISGIISKVHRNLGDHIQSGAPLLELDSIELAAVKSDYLAALSRIELARQTLEREEMLLEKGISAEQDYLAASQACDAELITRRAIEQQLRAMGLSGDQISAIGADPDASLTHYTVYSPAGGEIIEKHAALGELVTPDSEVFTIGDLSTVWVRLNVYQQDFLDVEEGMEVLVDPGHGMEPATGVIDYIEPLIGEETRTAVARVVLPRSSHLLRPGLFVTGHLEVGGEPAELVVPRSAVVDLDQDQMVFVRDGLVFEPRVISVGRQTATSIEVLSGLSPGEEIIVEGAFQLKAELLKGTFDPHAGHAH